MNFTKATLAALTITSAFFMSSAQASIVDTITVSPNQAIGNDDTFTYTQDLTDQGFVFGKTTYINGVLDVRLTDKAAGEGGVITFGDQSFNITAVTDRTQDTSNGTIVPFTLDAANLADLNADGKISFTIKGTSGDFFFAGSTLTVNTAAAAVPEPMSLGLLAIGALGLGAARRRKAAK